MTVTAWLLVMATSQGAIDTQVFSREVECREVMVGMKESEITWFRLLTEYECIPFQVQP